MKASTTSQRSFLRRAIISLLLTTALWSLPGSARAQLYVGQDGSNTVGEYDAGSGLPIGAFTPITTQVEPDGLLRVGNTLYLSSYAGGTVGTYNATTGSVSQASFISGLSQPVGLAISGNILFVANFGNNTVGTYNASTGVAFDTSFITGDHNADQLAVFGTTLYVYSTDGRVDPYTVNSATSSTLAEAALGDFITGVASGGGLALSANGSDLYVTSGGSVGVVGEYNASNGNAIQASLVTGLNGPLGVAVSGNNLYVANTGSGTVGEYNATNGNAIQTSLITAPGADSIAFVPEPGSATMLALGAVALLGRRRRRNG